MKRWTVAAALVCLVLFCMIGVQAAVDERPLAHEYHAFRVASEQEELYLIKAGSLNSSNIRYADAKNEIIYRFDLRHTTGIRSIGLSGVLYQQLVLSVSTDGKSYTEAYRWVGDIGPNGNNGLSKEVRSFDLTPYLDVTEVKTVYIKIADSYTGGGWGGAIHPSEDVVLDVAYVPLSEQALNAAEMAASEHSRPIFGCNKAWGGGFALDTEWPYAGYGALALELRGGDTGAYTVLNPAVDGTGMDSLEFMLYLSDPAILALPFDGCLEIGSAGGADRDKLTWRLDAVMTAIEQPCVGWNRVVLPLETATETGSFMLSSVNYLRLYWTNLPAQPQGYTIKLDSFCLTDAEAQAYAAALTRIRPLLEQRDRMEQVQTVDRIGEHNFKELARACSTLRQQLEELAEQDRALAIQLGVAEALAHAEYLVARYEIMLTAGAIPPSADAPDDANDVAGGDPIAPPVPQEPSEPEQPTEPNASTQDIPSEGTEDEQPQEGNGIGYMIPLAVAVPIAVMAVVIAVENRKKAKKS